MRKKVKTRNSAMGGACSRMRVLVGARVRKCLGAFLGDPTGTHSGASDGSAPLESPITIKEEETALLKPRSKGVFRTMKRIGFDPLGPHPRLLGSCLLNSSGSNRRGKTKLHQHDVEHFTIWQGKLFTTPQGNQAATPPILGGSVVEHQTTGGCVWPDRLRGLRGSDDGDRQLGAQYSSPLRGRTCREPRCEPRRLRDRGSPSDIPCARRGSKCITTHLRTGAGLSRPHDGGNRRASTCCRGE